MIVNKKIIDMICHVNENERKELMKLLDLTQHKGTTKLMLAIFRDIYMFKEMSNALIMRYKMNVVSLESRVDNLEKELKVLKKNVSKNKR